LLVTGGGGFDAGEGVFADDVKTGWPASSWRR